MAAAPADFFSALPDDILCKILSFLPHESAIQTSFISSRWRNLWNDSIVRHGTPENIGREIFGFLSCFDEVYPWRHPRRLQFHFGKGSLLVATIGFKNKLHVDFSSGMQNLHRQHSYFSWDLKLNGEILNYQPCPRTFFVKILYLKSVCSLTSEIVSSLVSNLDFLENINIVECNGLQSLCIESKPKLEKLSIIDCPQLSSLHLRCSKLRFFRFRGQLPKICIEYHFNLAFAMLDFRHGPGYSNLRIQDFDPTLLTIKNSETLTLCKWTYEALIKPSLSGSFYFYKLKELWWIDNNKEGDNSDSLVFFLNHCPSLERLNVIMDSDSYDMPSNQTRFEQPNLNKRKCELEFLQFIKMEGFRNEEDAISFAEKLSQVAKVRTLTIETADGSGCRDHF